MILLILWIVTAFAFVLASKIIPGVHVKSIGSAFLVAAVYCLFSVLISWLLWTVLTIGTLGLALVLGFITKFIIAAIVLKIVDVGMTSLKIDGFLNAILAALVIAGTTTVADWLLNGHAMEVPVELLTLWVVTAFAFILASKIIPGVHIKDIGSAFLIAAVYGVSSVLISWLLWTVLTIGTLGLALLLGFITKFIVAAIVLKIVDVVMSSLKIDGFINAILAALVIAGTTTVADWLLNGAFG